MKIKALTLFCHELEKQKTFFREILGLNISSASDNHISIDIGETTLTFKQSEEIFLYHYCFNIPNNKLQDALQWLSEKIDLIQTEDGKILQRSESWNADMFYFYDAVGNIAEFIVHPEMDNSTREKFDSKHILSVNEIGMAVDDLEIINQRIEGELNVKLWQGNLYRFAAFGDAEGRFVVVNKNVKKTWFPTDLPADISPFEAILDIGSENFKVKFSEGNFNVLSS